MLAGAGLAGISAPGVGFTVALFIAELSYDNAALTERAKVGLLAGSIISAVAG